MAQATFLDGDSLSTVRSTINGNAADAETRLDALELPEITVLTVAGELTDNRSSYDPASLGTAVFTLPTPTAGLNGAVRGLWRTGTFATGGEYISITGNIDDDATGERRMGLTSEFFKFVCNGSTWLENGHTTQAFCTPIIISPTTFTLTTGFTKLTSWDTLPVFDTPGRLLWNSTTNQIDVPVVESAQDGYKMTLNLIIEYTNNRTVTGVVALDGIPINGEFPVNALGSGKPLMLHIPIDIGFPNTASNMEIQLKGEVAGTLDILSARWTVNRIKG